MTTRLINPDSDIGPVTTYATRWWLWNDGAPCPGVAGASTASCTLAGPVPQGTGYPGRLTVFVNIAPGVTDDLTAEATVSGGADTVTVRETAPLPLACAIRDRARHV